MKAEPAEPELWVSSGRYLADKRSRIPFPVGCRGVIEELFCRCGRKRNHKEKRNQPTPSAGRKCCLLHKFVREVAFPESIGGTMRSSRIPERFACLNK